MTVDTNELMETLAERLAALDRHRCRFQLCPWNVNEDIYAFFICDCGKQKIVDKRAK